MSSPLGLTFDLSGPSGKVGKVYEVFDGGKGQKLKSLFNNATVFSPYPEGEVDPQSGTTLKIKSFKDIHNNNIYDTSVTSLIQYTSKIPSMRLSFVDFAYLRYLGVYPNNRLIIARRFGAAIGNDLHRVTSPPIATMISWIPEGSDDFLSIKYNENWVEAEASYVDVLNDIGKATKVSTDEGNALGSFAARGLDMLPFPGLMEPLQRAVMKKFGLVDDAWDLPLGNPNLIREAKRRSTVEPDNPGSGLIAEVEVKMIVEYEQKFINGIDPTLVYLDIIQNAIHFGTSDAAFQMGGAFATGANKLLQNLISGNYKAIYDSLFQIVKTIFEVVKESINTMVEALINPPDDDLKNLEEPIKKALAGVFEISQKAIGAVIGKYKQRLLGITNALTGSPSTPWHITIGNPKKPIFSSGDMLLTSVQMELGKVLAFNDLPSTLKFTLSFKNARNLGAQEIFNRLNAGRGRSTIMVNIQTDTPTKNDGTLDQSKGPQAKNINTKSFDASPNGGETENYGDVQYATTNASGQSYYKYDDPNDQNSSSTPASSGPVNVGEAVRNDKGNLQNPSDLNTNSNVQGSAGNGNGGQTPNNTPQTAPKPASATANAAAGSERPASIPNATNEDLANRDAYLKDQNKNLNTQIQGLKTAPPGETDQQRNDRNKQRKDLENQALANRQELGRIDNEKVTRVRNGIDISPAKI